MEDHSTSERGSTDAAEMSRRAAAHARLGMFLAEYEELHGSITQQEIDEAETVIAKADAALAERVRRSAKTRIQQ